MTGLKVAQVENQDGKFLVLENDNIGIQLLEGGRWEVHFARLLPHVLSPGQVAVDAGANFGYNAIQMARQVGATGTVFAFEPLRIVYQQLCGNCFLNGLSNVFPFQMALGNTQGAVEMNPVNFEAPKVNIGNIGTGQGGERVPIDRLDSFELEQLHFMKVDVQGSELVFLQGAADTIKRCQPTIFIEIEEPHLVERGTSGTEVISLLKEFGYSLYRIKTNYPVDHLCLPAGHTMNIQELSEAIKLPLEEC